MNHVNTASVQSAIIDERSVKHGHRERGVHVQRQIVGVLMILRPMRSNDVVSR